METQIKRFLSLAMAILMVVTLLPANSVFAEDDAAGGDEATVCTGQADCSAETHTEDCPKAVCADCGQQKSECICCTVCGKNPCECVDPDPVCTADENCTVTEGHQENCPKAVCTGCGQLKSACICCADCGGTAAKHNDGCVQLCIHKEGCAEGKHDGECPLYLCDGCGKNPCCCSQPDLIDDTNTAHTCDVAGPHLFLKDQYSSTIYHSVNLAIGKKLTCAIGFQNAEGEDITLSNGDVTCEGVAASFVNNDGNTVVTAAGIGEGAIVYKVGETPYRLTVTGALPEYAFYSTSQRDVRYYLESIPANPGDNVTAYLMWADGCAKPTSVRGEIGRFGSGDAFTCTVSDCGDYAKVTFQMPDTDALFFTLEGENSTLGQVVVYRRPGATGGNNGAAYVQVNPEISVGIGFVDGEVIGMSGGAVRGTYDPNYPNMGFDISHCLVVFSNYGQQGEALLEDQKLYDQITKTVTVQLEEWKNYDGGDYTPTVELYDGTVGRMNTKFFRFVAEPGKLGEGIVSMSFKFNNCDYKVFLRLIYDNPNIEVEVGADIDLNEILQSGDTLLNYLRDKHPSEAERYTGQGFIILKLPAKTYNEVITANVTEPTEGKINSIQLLGHKDGTQMRGLVAKSKVFGISMIHFVGTGTGTAIRHEGSSTLGVIGECTFKNYDCAIEDVGNGFIRTILGCKIENCGTGIRIASNNSGGGSTNSGIQIFENWYENNETAIRIERLPAGMTPFRIRIYDSAFLFNGTDFDLENFPVDDNNGKVNFYFVRNYFAKNKNGHNDNSKRGPAKIKVDHSDVKVITNPVRKTNDVTSEYWIYTGENQHSALFDYDASSMLIDGDSFNTTSNARTTDNSGEIPISIVDEQGNEIAQWTF